MESGPNSDPNLADDADNRRGPKPKPNREPKPKPKPEPKPEPEPKPKPKPSLTWLTMRMALFEPGVWITQ